MKKPIFIFSFIARYWPMLLVFVAFTAAAREDRITYFVGPVFFLLSLMTGCLVSALFVKHLCFRSTIDAYTQRVETENGKLQFQIAVDFKRMDPEQKVWATIVVFSVLFISAAIIAASIAK